LDGCNKVRPRAVEASRTWGQRAEAVGTRGYVIASEMSNEDL
jgi:hypothetical protein